MVFRDQQLYPINFCDSEFVGMRRRQVGRRGEVIERAGRPDAQIVSYPCERSEVRDRCTEQQLVVVDTAVYVVAIAQRDDDLTRHRRSAAR